MILTQAVVGPTISLPNPSILLPDLLAALFSFSSIIDVPTLHLSLLLPKMY